MRCEAREACEARYEAREAMRGVRYEASEAMQGMRCEARYEAWRAMRGAMRGARRGVVHERDMMRGAIRATHMEAGEARCEAGAIGSPGTLARACANLCGRKAVPWYHSVTRSVSVCSAPLFHSSDAASLPRGAARKRRGAGEARHG